jgi:hypothetical protein
MMMVQWSSASDVLDRTVYTVYTLRLGAIMSKTTILIIVIICSLIALIGSGTSLLLLLMPVAQTSSTGSNAATAPRVPQEQQPTKPRDASPGTRDTDTPPPADWPNAPRGVADGKMTALNTEKTLLLETAPDGKRRLYFKTEVCLLEGVLLEVLLCKKNTKEHEAIIRTELDAKLLHAGLIAIGAKPGNTVQFVNPKTHEPEYKPASGTKVEVRVQYELDGTLHEHRAQEWLTDRITKKPMSYEWVFAGSRFAKFPDQPDAPEYYCANNGEVIAVCNFVDSMLDVPVELSAAAEELVYEPTKNRIPPVGSAVWVILATK